MQQPLQITIRDIGQSEMIEEQIRHRAEKLNKFSDQIISCHVVVELVQQSQHQGKLYTVRINLAIPGKELVVNHNEKEDLYVAIREAFDDMVRQLEKRIQLRHGEVKAHAPVITGEIVRLFKEDEFGFIANVDGDEFYFNAGNVVHPTFKKLEVGMQVHFIEMMGDEGPQAHRVSAKDRE